MIPTSLAARRSSPARVPVDALIQHLKHGKRIDEFLDEVPSVRREQAEAFLDIAEQELIG